MGFAQGAAIGQRAREQMYPMMNVGGAINPTALQSMVGPKRSAPQSGGPRPMSVRRPEGALAPEAIHRRAAELTLQEKEIDLQRSAVELQKMKEMNAIETRSARSGAIEKEYQDRLGSIAVDEALTGAREDEGRDKDFRGAMLAAHLGNGASVAEFINKYGGPNAKVESVTFDPSGSGGVVIQPAGTDEAGNRKQAFEFDSPEQLHKGLLWFMGSGPRQLMANAKKGGDTALGAKDRASIREKLIQEYNNEFKDPGGHKLPDAPDRDTWLAEKYKEITRENWADEPATKEGAIQKPEGEPGEEKPPVAGARKSPRDGQWYVPTPGGGYSLYVPKGTVVAKRDSVPETRQEGRTLIGESGDLPGGAIDRYAGEPPSVSGNINMARDRMRGTGLKEAREATREVAEKKAVREEKASTGGSASATWTDPKTGEKVTVTYDASGKRTEKREKKDKKDKGDKKKKDA